MAWQSLKHIMSKSLKKAGISEQVTAQRVLDTAAKLLAQRWGDETAELVSFRSFSNGVLYATSSSAAAIQTIKLEKIDFMNALNYELGGRVVFRITVQLR